MVTARYTVTAQLTKEHWHQFRRYGMDTKLKILIYAFSETYEKLSVANKYTVTAHQKAFEKEIRLMINEEWRFSLFTASDQILYDDDVVVEFQSLNLIEELWAHQHMGDDPFWTPLPFNRADGLWDHEIAIEIERHDF